MKTNKYRTEIKYQVVSLDAIVRYFQKDYKAHDPKSVIRPGNYYIDPVKGQVVFEMYIDTPDDTDDTENPET